ncbi:Small nuclear ribonucleoprotein-associated protein B [Cystobasidiomycetes sp. EMM_F5]
MQAATRKGSKMLGLINYRLRITLNDTRQFVGQLLAFDKHMNLVVADTEEFRLVKKKRAKDEEADPDEQMLKRVLGLVIVRGETIVSLSVEGPPPAESGPGGPGLQPGGGRAMPAGRGMGMMGGPPPAMRGGPVAFAPPGAPPGFAPPGAFPPGMAPPGFAPPPGFQPPPPGFGR